jgi:type II secretory pathway pseudopilin PulG
MMMASQRSNSVTTQQAGAERRLGVTLVEVLVSLALVLFIMVILSEAFVAALTATRELKAVGDMQERLRTVAIIMRRDLAAEHFDSPTATKRKLSGFTAFMPGSWNPPIAGTESGFFRIWQGSNTASSTAPTNDWIEGSDGDSIGSYRSIDHIVHFTSKLSSLVSHDQPITREEYYTTWVRPSPAPPFVQTAGYTAGNSLDPWDTFKPVDFYDSDTSATTSNGYSTFNSPWAEIAYYLRRAPGSPTAGGTPLYALYRRQRLILNPGDATQNTWLNTGTPGPRLPWDATNQFSAFPEMSCLPDPPAAPTNYYFNSLSDIANPTQRFGADGSTAAGAPGYAVAGGDPSPTYPIFADPLPPPAPPAAPALGGLGPTAAQAGDDLILPDVISFDVKALYTKLSEANSSPVPHATTDYFRDLPVAASNSVFSAIISPTGATAGVRVFDTWSQNPPSTQNGLNAYGANWSIVGTPLTIPGAVNGTAVDQINIKALQITIRVWDAKTQRTRQITLIQNM